MLVIPHKKRMGVTQATNKKLAQRRMGTRLLKPAGVTPGNMATMPQEMEVRPALKLQNFIKVSDLGYVPYKEFHSKGGDRSCPSPPLPRGADKT